MERLSSQRREKAERLRREDARLRSIGAGLLLERFFPGRSVVISPEGKPEVPGERCLSLSHSGDLAVLALADRPVGVDVERIRPVPDALAGRVLTEEERTWRGGSEDAFFFLWTRKEAALKCLGTGVDRPLASFSVLPEDRPQLDGQTIELCTVRYDDYLLSAAVSGGDAAFEPREIPWQELLD